jgi:hypothetical protein
VRTNQAEGREDIFSGGGEVVCSRRVGEAPDRVRGGRRGRRAVRRGDRGRQGRRRRCARRSCSTLGRTTGVAAARRRVRGVSRGRGSRSASCAWSRRTGSRTRASGWRAVRVHGDRGDGARRRGAVSRRRGRGPGDRGAAGDPRGRGGDGQHLQRVRRAVARARGSQRGAGRDHGGGGGDDGVPASSGCRRSSCARSATAPASARRRVGSARVAGERCTRRSAVVEGGARMVSALEVGFSPCPNDTFMFHALVAGVVAVPGFVVTPWLADIEALNERAMSADPLKITKLSVHGLGHVAGRYAALQVGAALGRGVGPLVVARERASAAARSAGGSRSRGRTRRRTCCCGSSGRRSRWWRCGSRRSCRRWRRARSTRG